jgi:SAM-dependent methyltransferase
LRYYFVGAGVDIGGKPDPLSLYKDLFPLATSIMTWDWEQGDAQFLVDVADSTWDFVHSSHCLEHLQEPAQGLSNWVRVLKPGGHLIVTVPDEDLYEQGIFPSTYNKDHKWTFTIFKKKSWSTHSINILDLVKSLGEEVELVKIERLVSTYRFGLPRYDQTLTPVGECGIEFVIRKRHEQEVFSGGWIKRSVVQPEREQRLHLNQYVEDMRQMKRSNIQAQPFTNDDPL